MSSSGLPNAQEWRDRSQSLAEDFIRFARDNLETEYPHAAIGAEIEGKPFSRPRERHPVFFGAFDWHSAVHGHWLLVRLLRKPSPGRIAPFALAQFLLLWSHPFTLYLVASLGLAGVAGNGQVELFEAAIESDRGRVVRAALLPDEKTSHIARYALERIQNDKALDVLEQELGEAERDLAEAQAHPSGDAAEIERLQVEIERKQQAIEAILDGMT